MDFNSLISSLIHYGEWILYIILSYFVLRVSSAIIVWVWRTLLVPIFEKRAYFYSYNNDGLFYNERRLFGLFRLRRNTRWLIKDKLVGYVVRKRGAKEDSEDSNTIYLRNHGKTPVGQAKMEEGVCKIILNRFDAEGGITPMDDRPVGYVANDGRIYKYYENRSAWLRDDKLEEPALIGQCELPRRRKGKLDKTGGEVNDADVLEYITWDNDAANPKNERSVRCDENDHVVGMDDSWYYFRKNWHRMKRVRSRLMKDGTPVADGARFPYAFLRSKLWRFLQVSPIDWTYKSMAWGYGYCTEAWRNPFQEKDDKNTNLILRAAAALLLARKEGFDLYEDEVGQREMRGPAPTALLSLCLYLPLYPLFEKIAGCLLFPFMGKMLNEIAILVGLFFVLWLLIVHPIRCILMEKRDGLEIFLQLLNANVGVTRWMRILVVACIAGIIASIFWLDYLYFPIYGVALIALIVNWFVFPARTWYIDGYLMNDNGQAETDEDEANGEKVEHKVHLNTPTKNLVFKTCLYFDMDKLKELRSRNPFRESISLFGSSSYQDCAVGMISHEYSDESYYSKLKLMKSRINDFASKNNMSAVEKAQLIMLLAQPDNVQYAFDHDCPELLLGDEKCNLLEDDKQGKGFREYCRFPTETMHDKRGDCDCHAAFVAALFAACGYPCCYICADIKQEGHAAVGLLITDDLKVFVKGNLTFKWEGKSYLYIETAGKGWHIGEIPPGFQDMLLGAAAVVDL
ncbi:MAG: hypothetical protein ACTTKO_09970 [Candidatus Limimorpha sp.]